MRHMWSKLSQLAVSLVERVQLMKEEGQALVEYSLILALIAVAAIAALVLLGEDVTQVFEKITTEMGKVL
jgi:pilus assembly protein Flp/PilA